ncbi:MAG: hypothetical protein RMJ35_11460 [Phycisphaerales bacterium]|nr:hypothetical protein [Phycisphaerales bacterium]
MFEPLEHRRLLTTSLAGGILTITGTSGGDVIQFARRPGGFSVFENSGQGIVQTDWNFADVTRVIINCGGASDKVIVGKVVINCEINGGTGNDTLSAGGGNDTLRGQGGNDNLFGGDGRDLLNGGIGSDNMLGGGGRDTVDYNQRTANLVIGLGTAADDGEAGEADNVRTDIETVIGGSGNDRISTNSGRPVAFFGGPGNDTLIGGSGDDFFDGGPGTDELSGQGGADVFQAQDGAIDTISGGSGNDAGTFDDFDLFDSIP